MRDLISAVTSLRSAPRNDAPVPYTGSGKTFDLFGTVSGNAIGADAYDAYGSVGTLFAIVKQIQESVASTEWHLYRRTSKRDKSRRTEVTNHAFLTVWDQPNKFQTGFEFREACQQHLDLVGETFIVLYMVGSLIVEMWTVRPDRMEPVKHPKKFLTGWIYHGPNGEKIPLEEDQVIQIKYPNPSDPYRGMGPVQTVLNEINASQYSAEWNKNFFINGARPGGVIELDYRMGNDEFNAFVARWRQQHQGISNAHRVAVLENAKWKDTQFTMADMQFVEMRDLSREIIREAFAFPKPMLGTVDDVNRANAEAGKTIMAENITIPRLYRWKNVINARLLPRFANGKALEHDFDDPTPIDHETANKTLVAQADFASKMRTAGWHPDDVLEAAGLPEMRYEQPEKPEQSTEEETTEQAENIQARAVRLDKLPRPGLPAARGRVMPVIEMDSEYV